MDHFSHSTQSVGSGNCFNIKILKNVFFSVSLPWLKLSNSKVNKQKLSALTSYFHRIIKTNKNQYN